MLHWHHPLNQTQFLRKYWQQQPVVLRGAISPAQLELDADELAGLACEPDIEARLIIQQNNAWELRHGPFDEHDFSELPTDNWTLLVQDVDKFIPEVAALLNHFDFIPDWRIDDIMISYATDQGGVGPHTDNYDVFLIQAQGQREWRISDDNYTETDLLDNCPLSVLSNFQTHATWLLQPGDILYLPPGIAHWGIAQGECMTWSLGLRSPNQWEIAQAWLDYQSSKHQQTGGYFQDNIDIEPTDPNRISQHTFESAKKLVEQALTTHAIDFNRWFGCYVTEPKEQFEIPATTGNITPADIFTAIQQGGSLLRHPWARIALIDDTTLCFQGHYVSWNATQAKNLQLISQHRRFSAQQLAMYPIEHSIWQLLARLVNEGLYTLY